MTAAYYDDVIEQGATWTRTLTITDTVTGVARDLTGYVARMTIRRRKSAETAILELTAVITGASGVIEFSISDEVTAALDFGGAVYDVELESPAGDVERILEGKISLSREVTY